MVDEELENSLWLFYFTSCVNQTLAPKQYFCKASEASCCQFHLPSEEIAEVSYYRSNSKQNATICKTLHNHYSIADIKAATERLPQLCNERERSKLLKKTVRKA